MNTSGIETPIALDNGEANLLLSGLSHLRLAVSNDIGKPDAELIGHTPQLLDQIDRLVAKIRNA